VSFGPTDQRAANSQSDAANNSDGPDGGRRQAVTGSLAQIFQRIGSGDSGGPLFVPLVGLVGALATAGFTATVTPIISANARRQHSCQLRKSGNVYQLRHFFASMLALLSRLGL